MRILFVCARNPRSQRRGDQLRAVQFLDALSRRHELVLLAPAGDRGEAAAGSPPPAISGMARVTTETYRRHPLDIGVALLGALRRGTSLQSALFGSLDLRRKIRRLAPGCDLAIVQLVRLDGQLDALDGIPVLVGLIDCLSLSFEARAKHDRRWLAPLWRFEARRLLVGERRLVERSTATCVVCDRDREHLALRMGGAAGAKLSVVPLAISAPAGADKAGETGASSERRRGVASTDPPPERPPVVILSGNLGYFPTQHGARWFLERVWPRLRSLRPGIRMLLAGARPGRALRALAADKGAEVVASPRDLFSLIRSADLAVAPLFSGAGIPVKVLEAWAAVVPVIASEWAASGAGARDEIELVVAETPDQWLAAFERLLDDPTLRARLVRNGTERLREHHSTEVLRKRLERWLEEGLSATTTEPPPC